MTEPHYSFVVPVLNEQETLEELIRRLQAVMNSLPEPSEVVLVDDGSTDGSYDLMLDLHRREKTILIIVTHSAHLAAQCPMAFELVDRTLKRT